MRMHRRWSLGLVLALVGLSASAEENAGLKAKADPRLAVLEALAAELERGANGLRLDANEPPFFLSLQVKDVDRREVSGRFGALAASDQRRFRDLLVDARVGSYEFDSTPERDTFGWEFDFDGGHSAARELPLDDDPEALRTAVWLALDEQYKAALSSYLKKRGAQIRRPDDPERAFSFSRETPVQHVQPAEPFAFDADALADEVRRASGRLQRGEGIFDSNVRIIAEKTTRWFVSTEGTRLVTEHVIYGMHLNAVTRAEDGMLLENGRSFYGAAPSELPHGKLLEREVDQVISELSALRVAPLVDPFTGPALLAPEATGVLFHEVLGHRLEGDRQDDENEGRTFRGRVGHSVLPTFVSLLDDPTRRTFRIGDHSVSLNGFYLYDDQGVQARPVTLVEEGILRGFLMSRRPVKGFEQSSGHGRSARTLMPVARMANLIVQPHRTVPEAKLKQMLIEEARRQGKPYGVYIKDLAGGNTNTASVGYQAFKGAARLVYRIDAKTGKEELVRGVELVGTPLSSTSKIIAMGDRYGVFNGYCGAESGYVPVSAVAPSTLVREVELQRTRKDTGRPPLLPPPYLAR